MHHHHDAHGLATLWLVVNVMTLNGGNAFGILIMSLGHGHI